MNSVYAIIPARGGSKGVPKKNIKLLAGFPLIAYSIAAAQMAKYVNRVIVSTDSKEIAEIARIYDAEVPFMRPDSLSLDTSKDSEFMLHAIDWFDKNEGLVPEYWVHLRPTTPLRDPKLIDEAIKEFVNEKEIDCLRSAHKASESPFKWFLKNENGFFYGVASQLSNEKLNDPRQDFPDVYIPDGYVDVIKTSFVKETTSIHGSKMKGFISPYCIEVDTFDDFDLLDFQLKKNESPVLDYLKKYYKD